MTSTPIPSAKRLALIFTMILGGLQWSMDVPSVRDRLRAPLITVIWNRLARLALRFAAIAARAEAGTLRPMRPRPIPPKTPDPEAPPEQAPSKPRPRNPLPQGFGWLVRMVPEAAPFASQLKHLLAQPEMKALLAAAPQAARLLGPLCRALDFHPDPAVVPPAPPRAKPRRPRPPRLELRSLSVPWHTDARPKGFTRLKRT